MGLPLGSPLCGRLRCRAPTRTFPRIFGAPAIACVSRKTVCVCFEQEVYYGSLSQMRSGIYTHIAEATSPVSANLAFPFHSRATWRLYGRGSTMCSINGTNTVEGYYFETLAHRLHACGFGHIERALIHSFLDPLLAQDCEIILPIPSTWMPLKPEASSGVGRPAGVPSLYG